MQLDRRSIYIYILTILTLVFKIERQLFFVIEAYRIYMSIYVCVCVFQSTILKVRKKKIRFLTKFSMLSKCSVLIGCIMYYESALKTAF